MSDSTWSVISCPDCSAKFKAPTDLGEGESLACPACGKELGGKSDQELVPSRAIIPEPAVAPIAAALQSDHDDAVADEGDGSFLPPSLKKVVSLDLSNLAVRDSNRKPHEYAAPGGGDHAPKLDNLKKLGRTSDEAFVPVAEGPRQRVSSQRAQKEILGWDDDDTDGREGSQTTVATTFKLVLLALPVLIGVGIFALNARTTTRPRADGEELANEIDDLLAADGSIIEPVAPPPPDPESVDSLYRELGNKGFVEAVRETVEKFLATATVQERLAHVRHPDRVRPLMESYYSKQAITPIVAQEIAPQSRVQVEGGFAVTSIVLAGFERLPIVLARRGDGLVIDWESFVGYGEMSLEEFITQKPTDPVLFRLRAKPDDYYNFDFNEKRHYCIAFTDLNISQRIYGYLEKGSSLAEDVFSRMASQQGLDFVTVKLRFPPNAKSDNQVIIDELVEIGWLMKEKS